MSGTGFALPGPVWLIGSGNMAGAMLRRWLEVGADPAAFTIIKPTDRNVPPGVRWSRTVPEGPLPAIAMLGFKPQMVDQVAGELGDALATVPLVVSILAGVEAGQLRTRFGARDLVRAMPNLPVAIGKGVVALNGGDADADARATAEALMHPLGLVEWVDAARFDAVTALAGSGPAFLYRFVDALAAAGSAVGIPGDQALRMALATVEGAALLAAAGNTPPGDLADRVASKGGSTRAGLDILDHDGALVDLLTDTLRAAERRNAEMAAAARK